MPMLFAMFGVSEVGAWNFPASQYRVDEFLFQCMSLFAELDEYMLIDSLECRDDGRSDTPGIVPLLPSFGDDSSKYATILRIPKKPSIVTIDAKLRRTPLLAHYYSQRIRIPPSTRRHGHIN